MPTIRDSVRVERPAIHRSKAEDDARSAVTKTAMVTVAAAGKIGRQSAANGRHFDPAIALQHSQHAKTPIATHFISEKVLKLHTLCRSRHTLFDHEGSFRNPDSFRHPPEYTAFFWASGKAAPVRVLVSH